MFLMVILFFRPYDNEKSWKILDHVEMDSEIYRTDLFRLTKSVLSLYIQTPWFMLWIMYTLIKVNPSVKTIFF